VSVTSLSYLAEGWGEGELWYEESRLVWHELPRPTGGPLRGRRARGRVRVIPTHTSSSTIPAKSPRVANGTAPNVERLVHRLQAYFAGESVSFADVELDIDGWTPFQLDVVRTLRRIPYGGVVSYADLARLAGHPRAQRAVGTFCARNRFPLVVPCHRVVSSDGLGSYGSLGVEYKKRLLALERVTL
jgi:O-6-methylguanine DNA methyltransferase